MRFGIAIFLFAIICSSCKPSTVVNQSNEEGLAGDVLTIFFNQGKVNVLRLVTNHFEKTMCGDDDEANRTACYVAHAEKIKESMTEDFKIRKNVFPYNTRVGLPTYPNTLHLEFIWNEDCRKQNGEKYFCLKQAGSYMKFLKEIGRYNPTILNYYKEYSKQGRVSETTLKDIHKRANEVLDFNQFNHRLFYLVHHLTNDAYTLN